MTLFGYDQGISPANNTPCRLLIHAGVFGGVIVTEDFLVQLNLDNNPGLLGTVTAIYDIGCFLGAIMAVVVGEPLGRKKTILLGTTIMSVGAILQITAYSVPQMIVGR